MTGSRQRNMFETPKICVHWKYVEQRHFGRDTLLTHQNMCAIIIFCIIVTAIHMFAAEYMYFKRCQNNLQKQMSSIPLEDVKLVWKKRQYHHQPRCVRSQYGKIKSLDLGTRKYTGKKRNNIYQIIRSIAATKKKIHDKHKNNVTQHDSQHFLHGPHRRFSEKSRFWTRFWTSTRCELQNKGVLFLWFWAISTIFA